MIFINLCPPFQRRLHIKFNFDGQAVSEKKMFKNNGHIQVYRPAQGQKTPWSQDLLKKLNVLSIW